MSSKPMKFQSDCFLPGKDVEIEDLGGGISRQMLGYDDSIMLVRAIFEQDAEGYVHAHPHSQVTFVESGVFDFTIGSETRRLGRGDCVYIPPAENHGAICIEAGVLLDMFSPIREDFLPENQ